MDTESHLTSRAPCIHSWSEGIDMHWNSNEYQKLLFLNSRILASLFPRLEEFGFKWYQKNDMNGISWNINTAFIPSITWTDTNVKIPFDMSLQFLSLQTQSLQRFYWGLEFTGVLLFSCDNSNPDGYCKQQSVN